MMTIREYKRAESLEEAWQLNQKKANRILGGMIWLKMETINVGTAIDLSGLGLDTIEETDVGFSIGAMVTLRQLETHPGLEASTHGAVREALRHIVGVQLRNLATVGGSVYSRFGFSDVLTMLLAMDCEVELYKGGILPLSQYAQMPYDRDILVRLTAKAATAEEADELIALAKKQDKILTVYHNRRFTSDTKTVKKLLESGMLGEVRDFESHFDRYRPDPRPGGAWREDPLPGSGIFYDLGAHLVDQAAHPPAFQFGKHGLGLRRVVVG